MRLDKYISHNLGITRSQAKKLIKAGDILVNDAIAIDAASKVPEGANVCCQDRPVAAIGLEYFMLHKPAGYVCVNQDGLHPTVFDLFDLIRPYDYHVAGRLDVDSTGLVLITNDGQWSHNITAPSKSKGKVYRVNTLNPISEQDAKALCAGILLKGEKKPTRPAEIELINDTEFLLTIREGKYHQIKRMLVAVGNEVIGLHRERIGNIVLDTELNPGDYRALTDDEIGSEDVE